MDSTSAVLPPASGGVKAYSRHATALLARIGVLLLCGGFACVFEPESVDDRGVEPLVVTLAHPADGAAIDPGSPIVVRLSRPWDPTRSNPDALMTMTSGGIRMFGRVEVSLTDLEMRFVPIEPWTAGVAWTIDWSPGALRDTDGRSARVPEPSTFRASGDLDAPLPDRADPLSFVVDVAPLLVGCATCHDGAGQVALTADTLVGRRSWSVPGRWLVLAGEPARSVLLNKLVDAPVVRFGTAMPPPWSELPPLDVDAVRTVERWIATGARP